MKDAVRIGDAVANQDALTVYSKTSFVGQLTASNIRVTGPSLFVGNTFIGDTSTDTLTVVANSSFTQLTASKARVNGRLHISSSISGGAAFVVSTGIQDLTTNQYNATLIVTGSRVGINTDDVDYSLEVNGSFAATTKSFVINYKNKPGSKLVHASLEGPEHGVYVRGHSTERKVLLPEYWNWLVQKENITIQLTPNERYQQLYVDNIVIHESGSSFNVKERGIKGWFNKIINRPLNYYYLIHAVRQDVPDLDIELKKRRHRKKN